MTPGNIDTRKQRRKQAVFSAAISAAMQAGGGILLLWLRSSFPVDNFLSQVLLVIALVDFIMLIPVAVVLRQRLQEIQGGEEDAARYY